MSRCMNGSGSSGIGCATSHEAGDTAAGPVGRSADTVRDCPFLIRYIPWAMVALLRQSAGGIMRRGRDE